MDDLAPYAPHVPDDCVPIFGIMVFGYIDSDGDVCGGWHYDGEVEMATLFGHMEMAKHFLANQSYVDPEADL